MEIIPDKRKVVGLVEQAYEGKLCLPNFQRDFVWRRNEVADLLRSILRRYFIGSLLLLRCDPQKPPFDPIFLRGANSQYKHPHPEFLILDGQQRLSSLIYALTAPDLPLKDSSQRRWFFLDLNLLLTDPDNDGIIFDRTKKELDGLDRPEIQYAQRILPCSVLLSTNTFHNWRDGFEDWLRDNDPENLPLFRSTWRSAWTTAIHDFQTFEAPVVELPRVDDSDTDALGRVCAIFEKLNSTGVELSVYDLLTARLYRYGIKLHDLWNNACKTHNRLGAWSGGKADTNKFGVLVLRTLALLRGLEVNPKALINLKPDNFDKDWRRAAQAMERALELITSVKEDGFGVFDPKWLPGFGLLPILAALRAEIEDRKLSEGPRADLRHWYWSNVFLERYSSAVESKSRKDYQEMLAYWTHGTPEPAVFGEARARIGATGYGVRDSASYASNVYSGVFCLLALRNARDWRRGESIELQKLQDHHIFPRAYLRRHGLTKQADVNSIVNRTLISDETNNKISDAAPADYLASVAVFPSGPTPTLMEPHFLMDSAIEIMRNANGTLTNAEVATRYEAFRQARESAIIAEIRRACGVEQSTTARNTSQVGGTTVSMSPSHNGAEDSGPEQTVSDAIWRILTRIPIPVGQQKVYRALYDAHEHGLTGAELAQQIGRDISELSGVLGALGSRINQTEGSGLATKPGITLVFDIQKVTNNQWHYRMLPELRSALEKLNPPWLHS